MGPLVSLLSSAFRLSLLGTAFSLLNLVPAGRFGAFFELNNNLATYYLGGHLCVVLLVPVFAYAKVLRVRTALIYGGLSLFLAWLYLSPMVRFLEPSWKDRRYISEEKNSTKIRVLFANVELGNESAADNVLALEQTYKPDIIGLVEVTPWLMKHLPFRERYASVYELPRNDHFGLAFYSTLPVGDAPIITLGEGLSAVYINTVYVSHTPIEFILYHPPPPVDGDFWMENRLLSRRLATHLRHTGGNTLVAGDFNATPHSRNYELIVHGGGMHNAMEGYGWNRTWNMHSPIIRLPIDHVLFRGEIEVVNWQALEPIGSDHLPLLVDFRVGN